MSFTEDDFSEMMKSILKEKNPNFEIEFEQHAKFMNQVHPYLHMTKEEMEEAVPDGMYEIGGGSMVAWTGKGGFIMTILAMQKELKNYT